MDWIVSVSILFLSTLMIMLLFKMGNPWKKSSKDFPPGPRPLPVVGNLHIMNLKKPYQTMLELSKQYGPIFKIQLGLQKMVVLTGYETIKEALVNKADVFAERAPFPIFDEFSKGFGIIFSHGENWRVMRRFMLTTLRDYGMGKRSMESRIAEECSFVVKKFESYKGKPFEFRRIMTAAVGNIIVSILLGKRYDYEDPKFIKLLSLATENNRLMGSPSMQLCNLFPMLGYFFATRKKVRNNRKELYAFINENFIQCFNNLDENDTRNFIDSYLVQQQQERKTKKNGYFNYKNLEGSVLNLFVAGVETITSTLFWAFTLMMKYPLIQKKVQEEITNVVGYAQPRAEHRTKMPYTDAVVHEVQRYADVVPLNLPHATTEDVTFKGYFIPKGTHVIPLLTSVLCDESQWERPHDFYPEHFLNAEGKFVKRNAFMPFSAGQRICPGETLAKTEIFMFFASLLQRFTLQPAPGISKEDLDMTREVGLTTPPKTYILCALPHS
ncbi:cytochrome P450 2K6-like isoform X1 [Pantherophis guttatus]|uniref:Cytochrome P450 2K6-like isoform X1 n=1 Tax=Pantherophis guttatus TaxID=94885 RepID=A0A6P9CYQ0_PANGU|nr:cytochrome P450 2K6-like isoform X1 [Pantherophis guttatus]